jgi:hypothetical protein
MAIETYETDRVRSPHLRLVGPPPPETGGERRWIQDVLGAFGFVFVLEGVVAAAVLALAGASPALAWLLVVLLVVLGVALTVADFRIAVRLSKRVRHAGITWSSRGPRAVLGQKQRW